MKKVLITGGGGFIGSHIVDEAVRRGCEVNVLDNFSTGRRQNLQHLTEKINLIEGDLRSYHTVHEAVRGCDVIFHVGALPSVPRSVRDPITSNDVNVNGTLNILNAAKDCGVPRIVQASSSSVYGANPALPKVETMIPQPKSPYAVSKLTMEYYGSVFHQLYGLQVVSLRYFNVFGPRQDPNSQYSAVIPKFIKAIMDGTPITIHGDGRQSRDFTYVQNVVHANMQAAMTEGAGGEAYNVGLNFQVSLNEMLNLLFEMCGRSTKVIYSEDRIGDVKHSRADNTKIIERLGFTPQVSFEEGLRMTVQSFLNSSLPYVPAFMEATA
ncbi:MAG: SDR family oxidoreductase [Candidatus Kapabacteria bacterium]|nr:SDR family oxidoreductase [Candidatus Kapabacteria bacterium]